MASMTDHTTKAFDVDLREISALVKEMGELAEKQIGDALDALSNRDPDLGQTTVARDTAIDSLQHAIEDKAVLTIARRQPMAVDLREVISALRVSNDLERIGDLAKNIGKRVLAVSAESHPAALMLGVERMGEAVQGQVRMVL